MSQDVPKTLPPVDWALPQDDPVAELERQMERGSQFTQAALDKLVGRLAGAEEYITELVGILKARGLLSEADLADEEEEETASPPELAAGSRGESLPEAVPTGDDGATGEEEGESERPRGAVVTGNVGEAEAPHANGTSPNGNGASPNRNGAFPNGTGTDPEDGVPDTHAQVSWPGIAFRVDPEEPDPPVQVNCAERMHVCHAVCCKLNFALTPEEVEAGKVKWDLGFPYLIRHGSNGYCCHNDTATGRCTAYADRPGVCHRYSCANDKRIWKDFDNMVLNEEWIRANLSNQTRITVRAGLPLMDVKPGDGPRPNGQCGASANGSATV